jgi:alkylation response protein AidB-like acyl-CoA dehydrogenase
MDFELPEEIRLLRETVRKFVDRELIPIEMHSMDGPDLKPEIKVALEDKARAVGLWQLDTPAEFGGQGLSLLGLRWSGRRCTARSRCPIAVMACSVRRRGQFCCACRRR